MSIEREKKTHEKLTEKSITMQWRLVESKRSGVCWLTNWLMGRTAAGHLCFGKTNKNLAKLFNKMQSGHMPHVAARKKVVAWWVYLQQHCVLHVKHLCCTLALAMQHAGLELSIVAWTSLGFRSTLWQFIAEAQRCQTVALVEWSLLVYCGEFRVE